MALAEGLKYSNDTIGDKLDAIAGLLNQQLRMLNITMGLISMSWQYQRFVLMKALQ